MTRTSWAVPEGRAAGLVAGPAAGLVWGLAFLVPVVLPGWSAWAITTGRYLAYGLVSALLFLVARPDRRAAARRHWRPALAFAVAGNVGYYLLLVLGIDLAGAPVTDIVIGCIPVTIALAGNLTSRVYPWRRLAGPLALATAGLVLANLAGGAGGGGHHAAPEICGLLAAFGAVALWTWYGLANARFLGRHPEVSAADWSTAVGLYTGAVAVASLPASLASHLMTSGHGVRGAGGLIVGSIVLGVGVSWAATGLWNLASARLPAASAGLLVNVETVAGYGYVYAARGQWPPLAQILGFALLIAGVLLVVRLPVVPAAAEGRPRAASRPVRPLQGRRRNEKQSGGSRLGRRLR